MEDSETNLESSAKVSESQSITSTRLTLAILGLLAGASIFVTGVVLVPLLSVIPASRSMEGEVDISLGFASLSLVIVGLCVLTLSATAIITRKSNGLPKENGGSYVDGLTEIFSRRVYSRVLFLSGGGYAALYAFASGILVYNPNVTFSIVYHVSVPSYAIATCCSSLGQTPLAVFYLTEHLGLLLVPINLLLLFTISWLVGLNVTVGTFLVSHRVTTRRIGWLGGVGAFAGLFSSCPTCASLAIFSILGGTSTVSAGLFLGPFQALFLGVSIPLLVASPIIFARSLRRDRDGACQV